MAPWFVALHGPFIPSRELRKGPGWSTHTLCLFVNQFTMGLRVPLSYTIPHAVQCLLARDRCHHEVKRKTVLQKISHWEEEKFHWQSHHGA